MARTIIGRLAAWCSETLRRIPVGSRHTLIANLVQQACAAALLFSIPNLLSKEHFSETVFVGVLMLAVGLADLGLSSVYGRVVPRLLATGDTDGVRRWDATVIGFGSAGAMLFGAVITSIYLSRYEYPLHAALIFPVPLLTFWASFHTARASVRGNFSDYRRFIVTRAVAGLIAIPTTLWIGVSGWFLTQLIAAIVVVARIGPHFHEPWGRLDGHLLRAHIREALLLALAGVAALQLLSFARVYASVDYPKDTLAVYGVAGAAYQAVAALVLSLFMPVTIDLMSRFAGAPSAPFERATLILRHTAVPAAAGAMLAAEIAPYVLNAAFPGYTFDGRLVFALVISVAFFPFFICWGNCLIGLRRTGIYLGVITTSIGLAGLLAVLTDKSISPLGAAVGQGMALALYPTLLLIPILALCPDARVPLRGGIRLYTLVLALVAAHVCIRWN